MTEHNLSLEPQYTPVLRLSDDQFEELVAERNQQVENNDVDWYDLY
ncbi:TPA: hypothetical protein QB298_000167 [Pasteurella multocida]|nr:hypothetical protein [Pasteurella multocida]